MRQFARKLLAAASMAAALLAAQPSAAETQLTVMVFQGVQNLPLLAAQEKGFFAKRGLKVEIRVAPTSGEWRDGLVQGRHQIAHGGVDNAVALIDVANAGVAIIMGGDNGWNHLFVQPEITSYADLRGKTVIVDAPTTAYALVAYEMLARNGLQKGDYNIVEAGATFRRFEAMQKEKSYAAGMLNLPFSISAARAGLRDMGRATDVVGPYLATAGAVMQPWAKANTETLVNYIQAYIEGLRWTLDPANRDAAAALLAERLKLPPDVAAQSYAIAASPADGMAKDAKFDPQGFATVLKLRQIWQGGTASPQDKYLDLSYYERALKGL